MESTSTRCIHAAQNISTSEFDPDLIASCAIDCHEAQQDRAELAVFLAYLQAGIRPRMIVELGYGSGGLSWALRQLPCEPTVLSVTLPPDNGAVWTSFPDLRHHVLYGDTHDQSTIHRVYTWLGGATADLLIVDADHTYQSAEADWRNYSAMLHSCGTVAFHDIALATGYPDIQVHRLWAELRGHYQTVEIVADPSGLAGWGLLWPGSRLDPGIALQPLREAVEAVRDMPADTQAQRLDRAAAFAQETRQRLRDKWSPHMP